LPASHPLSCVIVIVAVGAMVEGARRKASVLLEMATTCIDRYMSLTAELLLTIWQWRVKGRLTNMGEIMLRFHEQVFVDDVKYHKITDAISNENASMTRSWFILTWALNLPRPLWTKEYSATIRDCCEVMQGMRPRDEAAAKQCSITGYTSWMLKDLADVINARWHLHMSPSARRLANGEEDDDEYSDDDDTMMYTEETNSTGCMVLRNRLDDTHDNPTYYGNIVEVQHTIDYLIASPLACMGLEANIRKSANEHLQIISRCAYLVDRLTMPDAQRIYYLIRLVDSAARVHYLHRMTAYRMYQTLINNPVIVQMALMASPESREAYRGLVETAAQIALDYDNKGEGLHLALYIIELSERSRHHEYQAQQRRIARYAAVIAVIEREIGEMCEQGSDQQRYHYDQSLLWITHPMVKLWYPDRSRAHARLLRGRRAIGMASNKVDPSSPPLPTPVNRRCDQCGRVKGQSLVVTHHGSDMKQLKSDHANKSEVGTTASGLLKDEKKKNRKKRTKAMRTAAKKAKEANVVRIYRCTNCWLYFHCSSECRQRHRMNQCIAGRDIMYIPKAGPSSSSPSAPSTATENGTHFGDERALTLASSPPSTTTTTTSVTSPSLISMSSSNMTMNHLEIDFPLEITPILRNHVRGQEPLRMDTLGQPVRYNGIASLKGLTLLSTTTAMVPISETKGITSHAAGDDEKGSSSLTTPPTPSSVMIRNDITQLPSIASLIQTVLLPKKATQTKKKKHQHNDDLD
jgi:hypothetical protein